MAMDPELSAYLKQLAKVRARITQEQGGMPPKPKPGSRGWATEQFYELPDGTIIEIPTRPGKDQWGIPEGEDLEEFEQETQTDRQTKELEEKGIDPKDVTCEDLFPDLFGLVELAPSAVYGGGQGESSRIAQYQFVSTSICRAGSTEDAVMGYLYVKFRKKGTVVKYGPITAKQFKTFKNSDSLGVQCIGSSQNPDPDYGLQLNIKLVNYGMEYVGGMPGGGEEDGEEE